MDRSPLDQVRARFQDRSPWGPPWWVYGVAFAVANGIRQLVLAAAGLRLPLSFGVASWAVTGVITVVLVNLFATARKAEAPPTGATGPDTGSRCG